MHKPFRERGEMTHRSFIRKIKQGIDSSIAGHLEHLTSYGQDQTWKIYDIKRCIIEERRFVENGQKITSGTVLM